MSRGRIRSKRLNFTQVSNTLIFDNNLSNHAKVLGCMIQAKITIPDFVLYKTTLIKLFGKQEDTFNKYWRELKKNGYLVQFKEMITEDYIQEHYADKGVSQEEWPKLGTYYYEYEFLDSPDIEYAKEQNEKNNQFASINETRKKTEPTEKPKKTSKPKSKKSTGGKKHTVEVPHSGKDEQYNNTDINNTDINNTYLKTTTTAAVVVDETIITDYTNYFGKKPTKKIKERLLQYVEKFEVDVITYAFDIANSKCKEFDYVQGILNNWNKEQLYTFDEVYEANISSSK